MSKMGLDKERLTNKLTPDALKEYLNGIVDAEIKKPIKEINSDMIEECVECLLELDGREVEISEETVKQRAKSIIAEHYKPRKRRFNFKHMRIAAIACIVILLSGQIISVAAFSTDLFALTKKTFLSLIGKEIQQGNITFTASYSKEYKTVEELALTENIDIIVPTWMPDDIEIEIVKYLDTFGKEGEVHIIYGDYKNLLTVILNSSISNTENAEIYENDNIIFYIYKDANAIRWEYKGNVYNLSCGFDVNEYAESVIKNIK